MVRLVCTAGSSFGMNDDCVVRKLTADGDGAGDDKRFVTFISHLFKITRERDPAQIHK